MRNSHQGSSPVAMDSPASAYISVKRLSMSLSKLPFENAIRNAM